MAGQTSSITQFNWIPQPQAADFVGKLVSELCDRSTATKTLGERMRRETGTRLIDWIDHISIRDERNLESTLVELGFATTQQFDGTDWHHPDGLFPTIRIVDAATEQIAIKVESVTDFLFAHRIEDDTVIEGLPMTPLRKAIIDRDGDVELLAIERHGESGFDAIEVTSDQVRAALHHREAFTRRKRNFDQDEDGFNHASKLIQAARQDLEVDWTCDLFFSAERAYWQSRNQAARVQKSRQDNLGLGWANHDHHTYRSSRETFVRLVTVLEALGFICRERFFAGSEAGWGAQVLEQPACGIVIFADVDLAVGEVAGDFAHDGLPPRDELGTVGLWCKLHGEAFLQAGMHHLECQFDFDAARQQLAREGIKTMEPFTNFSHLKQAFTEGENWTVQPNRIDAALADGVITSEQADHFRRSGSIGSHMEILERNDGYKGFNQTGISEIIRETDPRRFDHVAS